MVTFPATKHSYPMGGSAMSSQHTWSTSLLCCRPVAFKLQLERSGSW